MFLPMSWTSPLTVARTILPLPLASAPSWPAATRSSRSRSMYERVRQARFDSRRAPAEVLLPLRGVTFDGGRELDQPLGGVSATVEDDVFDALEQILRDVLVHHELPGIDDAHVQAGLDGVV